MSMFKDEDDRNKFLLEQASVILSGLLSADNDIYYDHARKLLGGPTIGIGQRAEIKDLHAAIFRDLKEQFKNA
ncbi:TPA: hypothetical protein ACOEAK_003199 [Enterobacter ludwigii]